MEDQKTTCVHFRHRKCKALNHAQCKTSKTECAFYQTSEQQAASDEKWRERMCSLSEEEQVYYAEKYYGGKRVWNGE